MCCLSPYQPPPCRPMAVSACSFPPRRHCFLAGVCLQRAHPELFHHHSEDPKESHRLSPRHRALGYVSILAWLTSNAQQSRPGVHQKCLSGEGGVLAALARGREEEEEVQGVPRSKQAGGWVSWPSPPPHAPGCNSQGRRSERRFAAAGESGKSQIQVLPPSQERSF